MDLIEQMEGVTAQRGGIKLESDLNKKLRDMLPKIIDGPTVWERIENTAGLGTFDTFMGGWLGSGWIELKVAGPNAKPTMRPGQPAFGQRMKNAGIPAHVLCCSKAGDVKLICGWTNGDDWRELLVGRASLMDRDGMAVLLKRCMTVSERG